MNPVDSCATHATVSDFLMKFPGINVLPEGISPPEWPNGGVNKYDREQRYGAWITADTEYAMFCAAATLAEQKARFLPDGVDVEWVIISPRERRELSAWHKEHGMKDDATDCLDKWSIGWKTPWKKERAKNE